MPNENNFDRLSDLQNNMNERNKRMMQFSQLLQDETVSQHHLPESDLYRKLYFGTSEQSEQESQT